MGFAIIGPLARRSRLRFGSSTLARAFAPRFLQTPPHDDGGVENRRSSGSLPVANGATFAEPPQSGLAWLCFLFPLIEPDRRI